MIRIMGIDPGSRVTGYGIVDCDVAQAYYVDSGVVRLDTGSLPQRMHRIFDELSEVVEQYQPEVAAVEEVFVSKNPQSALKIGHARGSAICACTAKGVEVEEYSVRSIKKSVVGSGAAGKSQVKFMVSMLLGLDDIDYQDEADALAVALCHFQHLPLIQSGIELPRRLEVPSGLGLIGSPSESTS